MPTSVPSHPTRIAIFARWPQPGSVKTRLSPSLPASMACDLYRGMLMDALSATEGCGASERFLYWLGVQPGGQGVTVPERVIVREQRGADLGERLRNGFGELLAAPGDRALAIGADCPELDAAALREAFAALDACDLVLGPARDGGYYLIGLRAQAPLLFEGVPWGTEAVLEETLVRARQAGLTAALLDPLPDLDTPADLVDFAARSAGSRAEAAPHTRAALRQMGLLPDFN